MTGTTSPASVPQSSVVPSEVGWQFVPQYYTFVNKEPHRLHCFYNKNSTFIHGTEGEDGKPCYGQQEIHNKITSIGFEDCKVFIHSVDAQSSANGGIIIQVIGEMSNHGETWRKFVQTFFLAEQPNGYFVLNDIFRFLKEETLDGDGIDEDVHEPNTVLEPVPLAQTVVSAAEPGYEQPRDPSPPPAVVENSVPTAVVVADEAPTTDISETHVTQTHTPATEEHLPLPITAAPAAQPNGIHSELEKPAPVIVAPVEPSPVSTPAPRQSTPAPATNPLPTPAAPAPPVIHSQPAAAPAAAPTANQAPRSWASLAASNPKKWGAAVNQESRGTTEILSNPVPATNGVPAQAVQSVPAPNSTPQHHQQHQHQHHQHQQQQQRGGGGQHGGQGGGNGPRHDSSALAAAQSISHAQCFVKGVTESVSQTLLQTTLSSRFGPIKDLELVRPRGCAFIEFSSVDSARKAIIASSREGGIWIDVGGEVGSVKISVETKKEKADRQPGKVRGGGGGVSGSGGGGGGGAPGPNVANGGPERAGSYRGRGTGRGGRSGGGGGGGGASGPK